MARKHSYRDRLHDLQVELVKLQRQVIVGGERVLILFEGRDAAGKDGTIKRVVEHMSPRETIVWAPGVPSDHERRSWYFQRYVAHLPANGEIVLFNRSWYNRPGVERVMGFATEAEVEEFFETVHRFESMLVRAGINLIKYYLYVSKKEQAKRLADRRHDPLKQWKVSPVDAKAQKLWKAYTKARDEMLERTDSTAAPWTIVKADHEHDTRLNLIADLLSRVDYQGRDAKLAKPDRDVVFAFEKAALKDGRLAK
jgi:polyphosphate kinase 2